MYNECPSLQASEASTAGGAERIAGWPRAQEHRPAPRAGQVVRSREPYTGDRTWLTQVQLGQGCRGCCGSDHSITNLHQGIHEGGVKLQGTQMGGLDGGVAGFRPGCSWLGSKVRAVGGGHITPPTAMPSENGCFRLAMPVCGGVKSEGALVNASRGRKIGHLCVMYMHVL